MAPTAESYWVVPGYVLFWILVALAFGIFGQRAYHLIRLMRLGQSEDRLQRPGIRLGGMLRVVLAQVCSLRSVTLKDRAGLGHAAIFWGFMFFLVSYLIFVFIGAGFGALGSIQPTRFYQVYGYILDIFASIIILAIIWAVIRRYVLGPARLEKNLDAALCLSLIFLLMSFHLSLQAFEIKLDRGIITLWSPIAQGVAGLFNGMGLTHSAAEPLHTSFWWIHFAIIMGFLVYIPYSKHMHIMVSPFNIFFRSLEPKGALKAIDLEKAESFGVSRIQQYTWKQLLDLYACTQCGRCQVNCPAYLTGKPLSPKKVVLDLKHNLLEQKPGATIQDEAAPEGSGDHQRQLIGGVILEDELWACTTCRACMEQCPVLIEHVPKIIDLRRNLVLEQAKLPDASSEGALRSLEARGHPWRGTTATRTDWASGLEVKTLAEYKNVDILYWVGCTAALEDRNMKVAAAMSRVLKKAGVNFGILGTEETCCGEPARRLGNEYLFQMLAQRNIETFNSYGVTRIVTSCPHCFNTIKNEYPQFGGKYQVMHYAQLLAELLGQGKLNLKKGLAKKIAYHDSCYLGRYNEIYRQPRELLRHIPQVKAVELERRLKAGFCCGGGGGHMWMEERIGTRINQARTEEVIKAGADIVATACPYCIQMFDDGIKAKGVEESIKAMDLVELLDSAIE